MGKNANGNRYIGNLNEESKNGEKRYHGVNNLSYRETEYQQK